MARASSRVGANGGACRHRSAGRNRDGVGVDVGHRPRVHTRGGAD